MRLLQFLQAIIVIPLPDCMKPCRKACFTNSSRVENYIKRPYTVVFKIKLFNKRIKCVSVGRSSEIKVASLDFICLLGVKTLY